MQKHLNIIARTNGVGLDSDVTLLTTALKNFGYKVTFSHCRSRSWLNQIVDRKRQFDANIFLERVFPSWLSLAATNILIPNQERFPSRHLGRLKKIDHVLCKSQHASEIFADLGMPTTYISFTSKDIQLNGEEIDYNQFFHLAGRSTLKGTETILELWSKHPEWPPLTIVQHKDNAPATVPKNVRLIAEHLPYDELIKLANNNGVHLCTSRSEGWGHYIVEAMSCAALVITTNAPPMNELVTNERGMLVNVASHAPRHLGTNYYVDVDVLERTIQHVIDLNSEKKSLLGLSAQVWYKQNHEQFQTLLATAMRSIL